MKELEPLPIPLLEWYRDNARTLPWRPKPGGELGDPYRVWVSEIMLQQTRVTAVLEYFRRFMEELPTVECLAAVPEDRLMKLWQGLGYYNRARNLQKAARQVVQEYGGVFPSSREGLLKLSGVGEYTAGAIASIAFGQAVPAVDGNVLRVITRLTGDQGDITKPGTKRRIGRGLQAVIPSKLPGDFNQAMMDLGALICLPNGAPLCCQCPLAGFCRACQEGRTGDLPVKPPKKKRRVEERTVFLVFRQGQVALRRRPEKGLLAGLWEYPNEAAGAGQTLEDWGIVSRAMSEGGAGKHIFTHVEWRMRAVVAQTDEESLPEGWVWAGREELRDVYAVPGAFQSFAQLVEKFIR